jgi:hypothetical protein
MFLIFNLLIKVVQLERSHLLEIVAGAEYETTLALGVDHITPYMNPICVQHLLRLQ